MLQESLAEEKLRRRQESLSRLAYVNARRCEACPAYGRDLIDNLNIGNNINAPQTWAWAGSMNCHNLHHSNIQYSHPERYWQETEALHNLVRTPETLLKQLQDIIDRLVAFLCACKRTCSYQLDSNFHIRIMFA